MNNPHALPEIINRQTELEQIHKRDASPLSNLTTELQAHGFAIWVTEVMHLGKIDYYHSENELTFTDYDEARAWLKLHEVRLRKHLATRISNNDKARFDSVEVEHEGGTRTGADMIDNWLVSDVREKKGEDVLYNRYKIKRLIVKLPR